MALNKEALKIETGKPFVTCGMLVMPQASAMPIEDRF
jgi:hypothetical protein